MTTPSSDRPMYPVNPRLKEYSQPDRIESYAENASAASEESCNSLEAIESLIESRLADLDAKLDAILAALRRSGIVPPTAEETR